MVLKLSCVGTNDLSDSVFYHKFQVTRIYIVQSYSENPALLFLGPWAIINTKYQAPAIIHVLLIFSVSISIMSLCSFKRQAQGAESVPEDFWDYWVSTIAEEEIVFTCYSPSPY